MNNITDELFKYQDLKYQPFMAKLLPNIDNKTIIGVKNPQVKNIAKELINNNNYQEFLKNIPHKYYEENILHGYLISLLKDYDTVIEELNIFLPYVDNWGVCDIISPQVFKKNHNKLITEIKKWLKSSKIYTIRFAIKSIMTFFLDDYYQKEYLYLPLKVKSDDYYVKMMIANNYQLGSIIKPFKKLKKVIE